ncbi:MAG: hypothetical protein WCD37_06520 [Chloroflexia bacterium]
MSRVTSRLGRLEKAIAPAQPTMAEQWSAYRARIRIVFHEQAAMLVQTDERVFARTMENILGYVPVESALSSQRQSLLRALKSYTGARQTADEIEVEAWVHRYGKLPSDPFATLGLLPD